MKTVIEIAGAGYCSGCGVCAGVCSSDALKIAFNPFGEYGPVLNESRCSECGICLKVCPFSDESKNEDELGKSLFAKVDNVNHDQFLGYFLGTYVGHSSNDKIRLNAASGGITTQIFISLLEKKEVDFVACVLPNKSEYPNLFSYRLINQPADILKGPRSVYYPVEASNVIKDIIALPKGRIAFVGLPCTIKALRNATNLLRGRFKGKEILFLGLTCGGTRSKAYTEYLLQKHSGNPERTSSIIYRIKKVDGKSNDKGYRYEWMNSENKLEITTIWDHGKYWGEQYFALNSCQFCDDVFAELADINLMDAWLPEYVSDWKGNNLIITRSKFMDDLVKRLRTKTTVICEDIDSKQVINSQYETIKYKREGVQYRLYKLQNDKNWEPQKRVLPFRAGSEKDRLRWDYTDKIRINSREIWAREKDYKRLDNRILKLKKRSETKKEITRIKTKIKRKLTNIWLISFLGIWKRHT